VRSNGEREKDEGNGEQTKVIQGNSKRSEQKKESNIFRE